MSEKGGGQAATSSSDMERALRSSLMTCLLGNLEVCEMGDKGFLGFCFFDLVLLFVLGETNLGYIVVGECAKAWTSGESLPR